VLRNVVRARQKQFFLADRKLAQSGAGSNRVRNNRFELCKHVLRLVQVFEANAPTYFAVPATHRLPHWILMGCRDSLCRFPLEDLEDRSVRGSEGSAGALW
jgi:hypothetical protein